ncbi:cytidylyltransferase domain-containing protein [Tenacibaculum sp. 190524A05c]|uniref:cytidylyltransferase domain-containing protein n=1 Tax=Tenacibaculum platacis TaxID=3137852 RepID=UPI0031FAB0CC
MEAGQFKIGAIIQARLGSTRLPNKVLLPIGANNRTILSQIFNQLTSSELIDKVVLATSKRTINDTLEQYCNEYNIHCYRGDEHNVLSRFADVVTQNNFDYVLRFTADNPVLDTHYLKTFIKHVISSKLDYSYSQNLPLGCNFEMIKAELIIEANNNSVSNYDKEHVTPYIKRNAVKKDFFQFKKDNFLEDIRLTIDYPTDYAFIFLITEMLKGKELNLRNIKTLIQSNEWLKKINEINYQKKEYKTLKDEINDIMPIVREREMKRIEKLLNDEE